VARITVNLPENIVFENNDIVIDTPTLSLQLGIWGIDDNASEAGVLFDVSGSVLPLLSGHDIRKLIKWLTAAADSIDGKRTDKKHKNRPHYREEEDNEDEFLGWKK
jgi:hypothetical protein